MVLYIVCMYICMYKCKHVCMYVVLYVCLYVCICMYVYVFACMYVYMYVCMYGYMYVCMYVCIYSINNFYIRNIISSENYLMQNHQLEKFYILTKGWAIVTKLTFRLGQARQVRLLCHPTPYTIIRVHPKITLTVSCKANTIVICDSLG